MNTETQPILAPQTQTQTQLQVEPDNLSKPRKITSSIINALQGDSCDGSPNCDLCSLLYALTPEYFTSTLPIELKPAFDTDNPSYLNSDIFEAISTFERKIKNNDIHSIDEIPLVLFVNIVSGKVEVFSHSHIMFIIPNASGSGKIVYTMGLGQNKESKTITIRSPDFNPYIKVSTSENISEAFSCRPYIRKQQTFQGIYIVKAIEPLTVQYFNNFNDFLTGNIKNVTSINVGKGDIRKKKLTETIYSIQTRIPYVMFNAMSGENCA
jgi:hypothetical protein